MRISDWSSDVCSSDLQIFPRVRQALPDVELHLIGGDAPESVIALGGLPGVHFHGHVPDLAPFLDGCRIALAPLRYGAGVKGKVNLSMAHGQPVVATPCAAEGMRSEEHTSELQSLMRSSYAVFCLKKKNT